MELKDWIDQEIKQKNWSRRELARRTGLSTSLVQKILKGERNPSTEFCIKVAQALGESPEKLLRMAGILPEILEDETLVNEVVELLRTLTPDQKMEALKYVRYLVRESKKGQDSLPLF